MFYRFFAIFLFALFTGSAGLGLLTKAKGEEASFALVNPPRALPPFRFIDEKGISHDLKDFHGRYILLNLWASWCVPCIEEMPALNSLHKKLDHAKFEVIALSEDRDGADIIRPFYTRHNIDGLSVYSDPGGHVPFTLQVHGLPTTILINPDGLEIARLEGAADWTRDTMVSFLQTQTGR